MRSEKNRPRGVSIREDLTQATAQLTFQSEKRDLLVNWRKYGRMMGRFSSSYLTRDVYM